MRKRPENRKIDTLRRATCINEFMVRCTEQPQDPLSALLYRGGSPSACPMRMAAGVCKLVVHPWEHRFDHSRIDSRRSMIV